MAASAAIRVDPRTPPDIAALIGCAVSTRIGAVRSTAPVKAGQTVAVIGRGGVGLSAVMGAVAAGASHVIAIDRVPAKLDLALRAGAHRGLHADDAHEAAGVDHVLECIGRPAAVELALELVRPGGTVTIVGMTPQGERASFDVYRFVEDGKRILGSNYGSAVPARDFRRWRTPISAARCRSTCWSPSASGSSGSKRPSTRGAGVTERVASSATNRAGTRSALQADDGE